MRITVAAVAGGILGLIAAVLGRSSSGPQIVLATATAVAYLVLLLDISARRAVGATDWLIVQLLLAGNLAVVGLSAARHIGWLATTLLLTSAIALAALALGMRFSSRGRK